MSKKYRNKRTESQIARDRRIVNRWMIHGVWSERQMTAKLNDRKGVDYTLSRSQVHLDIEAIKKAYEN